MPDIKSDPLPELAPKRIQDARELMRRARSNRAVAQRTIAIFPGDNVQKAIDVLRVNGGGRLLFQAGIHNIDTSLIGYSGIELIGENSANTIISFSGSANLSFAGTDIYTTGTITSVTNGVMVTGLGTSWLANVTTDHQLFIGKRWYKIAAITSDTTIILGEGFAGLGSLVSFPGVSYRMAKVILGVEIEEITFKGSSVTGITFDDCRDVILEDVVATSCNKGIVFTNTSQGAMDRVIIPANTDNGIEFNSCGFFLITGLPSVGNGRHGMVLNDCRVMPFSTSAMDANTDNGINIIDCDTILLETELANNGGKGAEVVSGSTNIIFQNSPINGNVSDGIKVTDTSDNCQILNTELKNNGGYGINIASSNCDNTIVTANFVDGNTSGPITDLGVGSVYSGNKGIYDKKTEKITNVSGGSLELGNVVIVSGTVSVTKNSDADPETDTMDAKLDKFNKDVSFASIRGGNADSADASIAQSNMALIAASTTNNQFSDLVRAMFLFDISSIPSGAVITSVTFEIYVTSKSNGLGNLLTVVVSSSPVSNTVIATTDYTNVGSVAFSDTIAINSLNTSSYNLWTLNASGLTHVNDALTGDGIVKLATLIDNDRSGSAPSWVSGAASGFAGDYTDGVNKPKLIIVYTLGTGGGEITTTATGGNDKVFGMVEETIADEAAGSVQIEGFTTKLKVNGVTSIAIGDFLTTYTEVGISAKAGSGDMAYAYALEAYLTNDSNGVISARLITPRKL